MYRVHPLDVGVMDIEGTTSLTFIKSFNQCDIQPLSQALYEFDLLAYGNCFILSEELYDQYKKCPPPIKI